jgi:hypothetical protein
LFVLAAEPCSDLVTEFVLEDDGDVDEEPEVEVEPEVGPDLQRADSSQVRHLVFVADKKS